MSFARKIVLVTLGLFVASSALATPAPREPDESVGGVSWTAQVIGSRADGTAWAVRIDHRIRGAGANACGYGEVLEGETRLPLAVNSKNKNSRIDGVDIVIMKVQERPVRRTVLSIPGAMDFYSRGWGLTVDKGRCTKSAKAVERLESALAEVKAAGVVLGTDLKPLAVTGLEWELPAHVVTDLGLRGPVRIEKRTRPGPPDHPPHLVCTLVAVDAKGKTAELFRWTDSDQHMGPRDPRPTDLRLSPDGSRLLFHWGHDSSFQYFTMGNAGEIEMRKLRELKAR